MKGDPKVIEFLNHGLWDELTSINQYWLHLPCSQIGGSRESVVKGGFGGGMWTEGKQGKEGPKIGMMQGTRKRM